MHSAHEFLQALTVVLGVAAITTVLFHLLRQPVVLGYLLAGVIVGPHVPVPLVADPEIVQTLSELGVILLMFSVGLEFRLGRLAEVGSSAGLTAVIECSFMTWVGFVAGRAFGWTVPESLFTGAIVAIASTTIVVKAFAERGIAGRQRDLVIGILVAEDLIAILLMAGLTAVATGRGLSPMDLATTVGRLAAFLAGMVAVGMLVVPRGVRAILRLKRPETTVVAAVGFCFAIALLAQALGYSVALGAFLAGSLVAESGEGKEIEHRIEPVRDVFAAIFFVSVGMLIDPALIAQHWVPVAVLATVVILGKITAVSAGAFLTGSTPRVAVQSGMSLAQIGEFSFIIAGLGVTLGATRNFLYPIAVAVSAITALTTPYLIRASGPVADRLDRHLPHRLQTFAALYGTWVMRIRTAPPDSAANTMRRVGRLLVFDAFLLGAIVIGASIARPRLVALLDERAGVRGPLAIVLIVVGVVLLSAPFGYGVVRLSRRLGALLADSALPRSAEGRVDLADAPRRALLVTLQLLILLLVGTPLVAITQPFLPGVPGAAILLLFLAILAIPFWRRAANLEGHVRAGAQVIVAALAQHARGGTHATEAPTLVPVQQLLPGLGEPVPFRLEAAHAAVGKTLAELGLRGRTGATVLALLRDGDGIVVPTAEERLRAGDVLALAGTVEAVDAARTLLSSGTS